VVADFEGTVAGYGYCALYRSRSGQDMLGRGVGSAILAELIRRCEALGYRQLIAVIGDSAHAPSIGLHASLGFLRVGALRSVGYKFGRWVDGVIMQRPLGPGDATRPKSGSI
jgi:phosphinothricin acetyltransferase